VVRRNGAYRRRFEVSADADWARAGRAVGLADAGHMCPVTVLGGRVFVDPVGRWRVEDFEDREPVLPA